jgi:hypothetical protein
MDSAMVTAMTAAFQSIVTDTMAAIAAVAPIGITIFGAYFVWVKSKSFFKSIAK